MIYYIYYDSDGLLNHELNKITALEQVTKFDLTENNILSIATELTSFDLFTSHKSFVIDVGDIFSSGKITLKPTAIEAFIGAINISSYDIILTSNKKIFPNNIYIGLLNKKIDIREVITDSQSVLKYLKDLVEINQFTIHDKLLLQMISDFDSNIFQLQNELVKIGTYNPEITEITYSKVATKPLNAKAYDLATYLVHDKKIKFRDLYHNLILEGNDPVGIITLLISQLDFFILIKISNSLEHQRVLGQLNIHPYRVSQTQKSIKFIALKKIQDYFISLVELDFLCKSGKLTTDNLVDFILYPIIKK